MWANRKNKPLKTTNTRGMHTSSSPRTHHGLTEEDWGSKAPVLSGTGGRGLNVAIRHRAPYNDFFPKNKSLKL